MLRLAADENFDNDIVRGVLRRNPRVDIVRIQDEGLCGADDPTVLDWAAQSGRVVLSHDVKTLTRYAYERVRAGKLMPGVVEVSHGVSDRHTSSLNIARCQARFPETFFGHHRGFDSQRLIFDQKFRDSAWNTGGTGVDSTTSDGAGVW